jgi:hypothetical protein
MTKKSSEYNTTSIHKQNPNTQTRQNTKKKNKKTNTPRKTPGRKQK